MIWVQLNKSMVIGKNNRPWGAQEIVFPVFSVCGVALLHSSVSNIPLNKVYSDVELEQNI